MLARYRAFLNISCSHQPGRIHWGAILNFFSSFSFSFLLFSLSFSGMFVPGSFFVDFYDVNCPVLHIGIYII